MYLQKVTSKKIVRKFLDFPDKIHKNNPNYIKALDQDIESVFDRNKNPLFEKGDCCRWLLFNENDEVIGRIAAFFIKEESPVGGIGFFECIDCQYAADFMFDHCKFWLKNNGLSTMDGPINFGDRMKWWGLLIQGFQSPLYGMNYHPPYYQKLFENYGFMTYFQQNCYSIELKTKLPEKFYRIKNIISGNLSYQIRSFNKIHLEKFAKDFVTIYNKAWHKHDTNMILDEKEVIQTFRKMKSVVDKKTIWFAYYKDEPIGCWLNLPNLNDYFNQVNSSFGLPSILKFLWLKKYRPTKRLVGIVFGIVPEFQNKGIDAYLVVNALETINSETNYEHYEVQWIGDFNPKMTNIIQNMNGKTTRTLATYRYQFNSNEPFIPHKKF